MKYVKENEKGECFCIGCGGKFDKYGVVHFSHLNICDACLTAYPDKRDDATIIAYYKAKEVK